MRKVSVCIGLAMLLGCLPAARAAMTDSGEQVSVEGARRAGETVRTGGDQVPLLHALEQVVPASYSVNVPNAGAWADAPVSWHAGQSFVKALREMLAANPALRARVDTDQMLVTVTARARPPGAAPQALLADAAAVPAPAVVVPAVRQAPALVVAAPAAASGVSSPVVTTASIAAALPVPAQTGGQSVVAAPALLPAQAPLTSATAAAPPVSASSTSFVVRPVAASTSKPALSTLPTQHEGAAVPPSIARAPVPDAPSAPAPVWEMRVSDGSVRNALQRWAKDAGWQFIWDVPTDFTVDADATIHGTLEEALRQVAEALRNSQVPIQVILYSGNRVLRVIPKGAA